jgi:Ca2+-binding RTX toxin-like protein
MMTMPPVPPPSKPRDYEGIREITGALTANCVISGTAVSLTVADGESVLVGFNSSDNKITLNANNSSGQPCEVGPTSKLTLTASGTAVATGRTVILDYSNGLFMKGNSTPGIVIDFTIGTGATNSTDTVQVRGSAGVDRFTAGAGAVSPVRAININAGSGTGLDSLVDVTLKSIETLVFSAGAEDDILSGQGGFGTGTAYTTVIQFFGGAGNDVITGGNGNDQITGGDDNDVIDGAAGNDTHKMGAANDGDDIINVTITPSGNDIVDYSLRTVDLTIAVDGTATSGASGESDTINNKVVTILGGAGNDTISIASNSTVNHVVTGGAGDDTFTGSNTAADTFNGEGGADTCIGDRTTMTYASRSVAMTVTICDPSGDCSASNNDGDSSTIAVQKSGVNGAATDTGTASDDAVTVSSLAGMTQADVGRKLRLSGFTGVPGNDDGSVGFPITAVTDATTVTIDVTEIGGAPAAFDETDLAASAGLTWTVVGAEKDNVQCANVIGGTVGDTLTGDARNNIIRGGAGADTLEGGAGNDVLQGDADADNLYGGDGSDTLRGGAGDDNLYGGDGNDILEGDAGTDVYECDGANANGGGAGSAPGEADFSANVDMGESRTSCEH